MGFDYQNSHRLSDIQRAPSVTITICQATIECSECSSRWGVKDTRRKRQVTLSVNLDGELPISRFGLKTARPECKARGTFDFNKLECGLQSPGYLGHSRLSRTCRHSRPQQSRCPGRRALSERPAGRRRARFRIQTKEKLEAMCSSSGFRLL